MCRTVDILRATMLGLLFGLLMGPAAAAPDKFDIVGLRLGMTVEEARAAVLKHAPSMQLTDKKLSYSYRDGVQQLQSPAFLAEILGVHQAGPATTDRITLYFSAPPKPQRLIGVNRHAELPNPPTHAQLMNTVVGKYGPPDESRTITGLGFPQSSVTWAEPGRPQCSRPTAKLKTGIDTPTLGLDTFKKFARQQQQGWAPADLSQCGASLRYEASRDPVIAFVVRMTDTGYWLGSLQATMEWVSGLEAEATKARIGKASTPKL